MQLKYNMLGRIVRQSLPLYGTSKSCKEITPSLKRNLRLHLERKLGYVRNINTSCTLRYSQQNPKEKPADLNTEKDFKDEDIDKTKKKSKSADKSQHNNTVNASEKESKERIDEDEDEFKQYKQFGDSRKQGYENEKGTFNSDLMLYSFDKAKKKEKETFLECLRRYENFSGRKRERVLFIYAALKYMEKFGVHKDLEVYKALIDIFPKETMIPTNVFQSMFMHYPKEQYCATTVLEQMEDNGVIPDGEMESLLLNIFGRHGMPLEKYWKMMYWMPKFKNLNPWPVPSPIPNDTLELAKLAMKKISSIDVQSEVTVFDSNDVPDSVDKTWIVSAIAPTQKELLLKHDKSTPAYVEGPFPIYVATKSVDYFVLRANPDINRKFPDIDTDRVDQIRNPYLERKTVEIIELPSVHEQFDATIYAVCATGMSTKDSLLSWIRCLEKDNPVLADIPVVFTLRNYSQEKFFLEDGSEKSKDSDDKLLQ